MNKEDRQTFYLIGASSWLILSLSFMMIAPHFSLTPNLSLALECWFAMLPVSWTIALLWAWKRERLRGLISSQIVGGTLSAAAWLGAGLTHLRASTPVDRASGGFFLVSGLLAIYGIVSQWRKDQKTASSRVP